MEVVHHLLTLSELLRKLKTVFEVVNSQNLIKNAGDTKTDVSIDAEQKCY